MPTRPWQPSLALIVVLLGATAVSATLAAAASTADECAARLVFTIALATFAGVLVITRHREQREQRTSRRVSRRKPPKHG